MELLYEEAKHYVLNGRYIMEPVHSLMLGGIQARIELGPYNPHTHTIGFFRSVFKLNPTAFNFINKTQKVKKNFLIMICI